MGRKSLASHDEFITATSPDGRYHTQEGNCYLYRADSDDWIKIECYLGCVP